MKKLLILGSMLFALQAGHAQRMVFKFGVDGGFNRSRKFNKIIDAYNDKAGGETVLKRMNTYYGYTIEFGGSVGNSSDMMDLTIGITSHTMPLMESKRVIDGKLINIQPHYTGFNFWMITQRKGKFWWNLNVVELGRFTMKYNLKGEKPWGGNVVKPIAIGSYTFGGGFGFLISRVEVGIKTRTTVVGAYDHGLAADMGFDPFVKRTYAYSELGLHLHFRIGG